MLNMRAAGNKKKEEKVERTLKSYLLQEAEATSRGAKVAWLQLVAGINKTHIKEKRQRF